MDVESRHPVEWPLPLGPYPPMVLGEHREGTSLLERAALARTEACLASLRATDLVRLCLWPEILPDVARAAGKDPATLRNALMFRQEKPNRPSRDLLARKLGLAVSDMDYVIETPRALIPPGRRSPHTRNGEGALEQLTLRRVRENLAAFKAGIIVQMVIWPFSERELADAVEVDRQHFYETLAGLRGPYRAVRERVCTFLGVEGEVLDHLIDAVAADPVALGES